MSYWGFWELRQPVRSWCDQHLRHAVHIELIKLLIVACGILVHSSVSSYWILAGIETRCCIHRFRESQTCSMGDMSAEYAKTGMFIMLKHEVMFFEVWHNNGPEDLASVSLCLLLEI